MHAFFEKVGLAALLLGLSAGAAGATPMTETFNISGAFADPYHTSLPGGTFSGTFGVSGNVNSSNMYTTYTLTAVSISVTGFGPDLGGFTFVPLTYTLGNSTVAGTGAFQYFELDTTSGGDQLRVYFTVADLSTSGGTLSLANSYEHQPAAGNRAFLSGTVTATPVPEPLTLSIFGSGLAGMAALRRRAKKSNLLRQL